MLRKLGYGRGWGRPWLEEEEALLRQVYANGESLAPLRERLGRSRTSIAYKAGEMGLQGTHARPNGWRTEPAWSETDVAILRRNYGRVRTDELAKVLGRPKAGVFNKAWSLGLRHGFMRAFTEEEQSAIRLAHAHGLSLTDFAAALGRDVAVVSKHAIRLGVPFKDRAVRAPRTCRAARRRWTLAEILTLAGEGSSPPDGGLRPARPSVSKPLARTPMPVTLPGVPPMQADLLAATHAAGLLTVVAETPDLILLRADLD